MTDQEQVKINLGISFSEVPNRESNYRGRIAPTPSGLMHLGHAQTFWIAMKRAAMFGGKLILRVEDIDRQRCKSIFLEKMIEDLSWFGLVWHEGPGETIWRNCLLYTSPSPRD